MTEFAIPVDMADRIKSEFPEVKLHLYDGIFTAGLGVEFDRDGKPWRNGWNIQKDITDWKHVEEEVIKWLRNNVNGPG